jgi:hypothetical protein
MAQAALILQVDYALTKVGNCRAFRQDQANMFYPLHPAPRTE